MVLELIQFETRQKMDEGSGITEEGRKMPQNSNKSK